MPSTHHSNAPCTLGPGDHACLPFVDGPDVDRQVAAFLAEGMIRNEQCLLVSVRAPKILGQLRELGVSVTEQIARAALLVVDPVAFYQREDSAQGTVMPPPEVSLGNVIKAVEGARAAGFRALRGAGGMTDYHRFGAEDFRRLDEYEARATEILRQTGTTGLCLYDRDNHANLSLEIMLRTHPLMVVEGRPIPNHFCEDCGGLGERSSHGESRSRSYALGQVPRLAAEVADLRERARNLDDELDSRNSLLSSLSRRLDGPVQRLTQTLDQLSEGNAPGNWLERLRDAADGIGQLTRLLHATSEQLARNDRPAPSSPSWLDLGDTVGVALERWLSRQEGHRPEVRLRTSAPCQGHWDRSRVETIVGGLLDAIWERAWGTGIDLQVDDAASKGRISVSYGDIEVMAACPLEAAPQERLLMAAGDQLRIALWVTRENARLTGGTLGLSIWPDGRVAVTVDLPKLSSSPATTRAPG